LWQEKKAQKQRDLKKAKKTPKKYYKNKSKKRIFWLKKRFFGELDNSKKGVRLSSVHQVVCFTSSYQEIIDNCNNNTK